MSFFDRMYQANVQFFVKQMMDDQIMAQSRARRAAIDQFLEQTKKREKELEERYRRADETGEAIAKAWVRQLYIDNDLNPDEIMKD